MTKRTICDNVSRNDVKLTAESSRPAGTRYISRKSIAIIAMEIVE